MGNIAPSEGGSASGSLSPIQQLAAAVGTGVATTVYFGQSTSHGPAYVMTASAALSEALPPLSPQRGDFAPTGVIPWKPPYVGGMCFSPQADLVGGLVVGALGVDAVRHVGGRKGHLAIAALPLILGAHELDETFVWLSLQGHVSHSVGRATLYIYLAVAFVLLPIFVPLAVLLFEPTRMRRWLMTPFVTIGMIVAAILCEAIVRGPVRAVLRPYHVDYSVNVSHGGIIVALYVLAVCGALLISGYRPIVVFGVINLVAVAIIARLTIDGFASVWCGWAAVSSGAVVAYMRFGRPLRRPVTARA